MLTKVEKNSACNNSMACKVNGTTFKRGSKVYVNKNDVCIVVQKGKVNGIVSDTRSGKTKMSKFGGMKFLQHGLFASTVEADVYYGKKEATFDIYFDKEFSFPSGCKTRVVWVVKIKTKVTGYGKWYEGFITGPKVKPESSGNIIDLEGFKQVINLIVEQCINALGKDVFTAKTQPLFMISGTGKLDGASDTLHGVLSNYIEERMKGFGLDAVITRR